MGQGRERTGMIDPIIGVSGIRGIVGESFTPEFLARFGAAFGVYLGRGRVVVGRDTRKSGEMIKHLVIGGLLASGCEVYDIGVATTPSCQIMVEEMDAAGGLVVSGSHNPEQWNALKFLGAKGLYLNRAELTELLRGFKKWKIGTVRTEEFRPVITEMSAAQPHLSRILRLVEVQLIRSRNFKVVVDYCNGAGALITPALLRELGCEISGINCVPNGTFLRNPEPTFVSLGDLARAVKEAGADVGFAQDPDADRLAVVSERGEILGEEYTLVLASWHVLSKRPGVVVTNYSTTRAMDDVATMCRSRLVRAPVGEINVVQRMIETNAVFGGEGNGGVIDPRVHHGRDSLVGMALILELMAESGKTVSQLMDQLPRYYIQKEKIEFPKSKVAEALERLRPTLKGGQISDEDGLRVDWEDGWAHIRASGTEHAVRVITEATSPEKCAELNEQMRAGFLRTLSPRRGSPRTRRRPGGARS